MNNTVPERIKIFNASRDQAIVPLKYKTMAESPFHFFRGTCHLFYEDLLKNYPFADSPVTWISGDLHIENFGSYKGIDRCVYFDINDFDEAVRAPVLFELSRLLVSVELATTEINISAADRADLCHHLLHHYRHSILDDKSVNNEDTLPKGLIKNLVDKVSSRKEDAILVKRTNDQAVNAKLLFNANLLTVEENEKEQLAGSFETWFFSNYQKKYNVTDIGFRIAGTGSIGVKRYCCLLENENDTSRKKLIDIKQSLPSSVLRFKEFDQPQWSSEAERIVQVQQLMQREPPAYLSQFLFKDQWYVVKELQPTDDKISIAKTVEQPQQIVQYLEDLGKLTAAAQLRSCNKYGAVTADELTRFANDDSWVSLLIDWSMQYATQVKEDHQLFSTAWKQGYFN